MLGINLGPKLDDNGTAIAIIFLTVERSATNVMVQRRLTVVVARNVVVTVTTVEPILPTVVIHVIVGIRIPVGTGSAVRLRPTGNPVDIARRGRAEAGAIAQRNVAIEMICPI